MSVGGVQVKICGMRDADLANFALNTGADYVGMIHFPRSPRHVTVEEIEGMLQHIDPRKSVVVLVEPEIKVLEQFKHLGVGSFQIHTKFEDKRVLEQWADCLAKDQLWLVPKIPPGSEFPEFILNYASTIVMDTFSKNKEGGTGKTGDWGAFRSLINRYSNVRFLLAGGLNPENVGEALVGTDTRFIDVNSGVESSPGVKDIRLIERLFQNLKFQL